MMVELNIYGNLIVHGRQTKIISYLRAGGGDVPIQSSA
jgi:hypothetical protein